MTHETRPSAPAAPIARPELEREIRAGSLDPDASRPVHILLRVWNTDAFRKALVVAGLLTAWQLYANHLDDPLMLPSFTATLRAWWDSVVHGELLSRTGTSLRVLLIGYGAGILCAGVLTGLAVSWRLGSDLLATLTAALNPLPAVALLPIALLWFGLGTKSMVFILIHAVLWPLALNTHAGFAGVSETLRMVGRNYGLSRTQYLLKLLIPAALPSILAGLKIGWAFAWRTLIAVELVFGVSSGSGGLGWFIYENKQLVEIDKVFAGLLTVTLLGFIMEHFVFRTIENYTVRKWGMKV